MKKWILLMVLVGLPTYYIYHQWQEKRVQQLQPIAPREEVSVRIIEGKTIDEITIAMAEKHGLDKRDIRSSIGASVDRAPMANYWREQYPFLKHLPKDRSLEGYLFPDTYRVYKDQLPKAVFQKQLDEFALHFATTTVGPQSAPLKTLDDVVILASIVEAEVTAETDRAIVAGIFLNRLRIGMALQTDASLSYLHGSNRAQATAEDLASTSPYNTYKHRGLPPGPIGNPGKDSIEAVLHPKKTDYFYFLTDKQGKVYYAKTLEEHARNRAKAGI